VHRQAARWLGRFALVVLASLPTLPAMRAWEAGRAPPLLPWQVEVPKDPDAGAIGRGDGAGWIAHETALFDAVDAAIGAVEHDVPRFVLQPGLAQQLAELAELVEAAVERVLGAQPGVTAVCVVGLPDAAVREHVAGQAQAPEHEEHADRRGGEAEGQAADESPAQEAELDERRDQRLDDHAAGAPRA